VNTASRFTKLPEITHELTKMLSKHKTAHVGRNTEETCRGCKPGGGSMKHCAQNYAIYNPCWQNLSYMQNSCQKDFNSLFRAAWHSQIW